jgi:hypothetical protein
MEIYIGTLVWLLGDGAHSENRIRRTIVRGPLRNNNNGKHYK